MLLTICIKGHICICICSRSLLLACLPSWHVHALRLIRTHQKERTDFPCISRIKRWSYILMVVHISVYSIRGENSPSTSGIISSGKTHIIHQLNEIGNLSEPRLIWKWMHKVCLWSAVDFIDFSTPLGVTLEWQACLKSLRMQRMKVNWVTERTSSSLGQTRQRN